MKDWRSYKDIIFFNIFVLANNHFRPANGGRRQTVNLVMFGDQRPVDGVSYHRLQWSSNNAEVAAQLVGAGLSVRRGRVDGSVRWETSRTSYAAALGSQASLRRAALALRSL